MSVGKKMFLTVILPNLLVQTGTSMGNAFLPLYARHLGASMSVAAFISSLLFIGMALADLPGGWLVHRFGVKPVMTAGSFLILVGAAIRISPIGLTLLGVSVVVFGVGTSLIWISRMAWMKNAVGNRQRGHAMSWVGGSIRIGSMIGPVVGGTLAEKFGYRTLFGVQGALSLAALAVILLTIPATTGASGPYRGSIRDAVDTWRSTRSTIVAAAIGIAGLTILRASREILIPLWGGGLGLGESLIGVVLFIGAAADTGLFWLSGIAMTGWGRKTTAVVCTAGLALAIGLLPMSRGMAGLAVVAGLAGIANSLGAGINLTISGDLAPHGSPAAFLSVWNFLMDLAGFGGPALASWMILLLGTGAAPPTVAATGFAGALIMGVYMRETGRSRGSSLPARGENTG